MTYKIRLTRAENWITQTREFCLTAQVIQIQHEQFREEYSTSHQEIQYAERTAQENDERKREKQTTAADSKQSIPSDVNQKQEKGSTRDTACATE